jgi:hypothetical protein
MFEKIKVVFKNHFPELLALGIAWPVALVTKDYFFLVTATLLSLDLALRLKNLKEPFLYKTRPLEGLFSGTYYLFQEALAWTVGMGLSWTVGAALNFKSLDLEHAFSLITLAIAFFLISLSKVKKDNPAMMQRIILGIIGGICLALGIYKLLQDLGYIKS